MPYAMQKLKGKDRYRVINTHTGEVHAKDTTKANAERQLKILRAAETGHPIGGKSEGGQ